MNGAAPSPAAPDFADMQGLVRFGYGRLVEAEFLLLEIADAAAAREWLAAAPVSTAEWRETPLETALQVAFSAEGLRALGLHEAVVAQFSEAFLVGMAGEESRSRRLGDIGRNAPDAWRWGREPPHMLLMLYARAGGLEALKTETMDDAFHSAFRLVHALPTAPARGREPFGFADGISEPRIDWDGELGAGAHRRLDYANLLAPGEVVLGHRNEYGEVTPRPLVDGDTAGAEALPEAADVPGRRDLGLNGAYLALRQIEQDVPAFWRFLHEAAGGDAVRREELAAAMVGRRRDGEALIPDGAGVPGGKPGNDFTYDDDTDGHACPLGAHIRRANPRTGDHPPGVTRGLSWLLSLLGFRRRRDGLPGRHDLVASTRFHRLVRRGREYGAPITVEDAVAGKDGGEERGLHFVCLCANLVRQFEFVQNAWIAGTKFDGLRGESDPLLGARAPLIDGAPTDRFTIQRPEGPPERIEGLPPFVTLRGGGYFFLPGLRALRYIARAGGREA